APAPAAPMTIVNTVPGTNTIGKPTKVAPLPPPPPPEACVALAKPGAPPPPEPIASKSAPVIEGGTVQVYVPGVNDSKYRVPIWAYETGIPSPLLGDELRVGYRAEQRDRQRAGTTRLALIVGTRWQVDAAVGGGRRRIAEVVKIHIGRALVLKAPALAQRVRRHQGLHLVAERDDAAV